MKRRSGLVTLNITLAIAALLLGPSAAADTGLSQADRTFIAKAAQGGLLEVAAGRLAAARALDPMIKEFGQRMVADHTDANAKLKSLADSKQLSLPESMTAEQKAALSKLEVRVGSDFDRTYEDMMVKDHVEDIGEFNQEVKSGSDPDVKAFAQSVLPTLQHHLEMAKQLGTHHN